MILANKNVCLGIVCMLSRLLGVEPAMDRVDCWTRNGLKFKTTGI